MTKLLQLPLKAVAFAARTSVHLVELALDRVLGSDGDEARWTPARPPSRATPPRPRAPRAPRPPRTESPPSAAEAVEPAVGGVPEPPLGAVPEPPVAEPPVGAVREPPAVPIHDEPPLEPPAVVIPEEPPFEPPEPTPGEVARLRARRREAETTDESPGAVVHVDEPWPGYAAMNAPEIIDRLRVSDDAVKAVVLLYERSHRARKTVLRAAGG
jgi:hypothetical protein